MTDKDREVARAVNTYFANFAKYGNPNAQGLPDWPTFNPARSELMDFTPDDGPIVQADPWKERLDLVQRAAEARANH